MGGPPGQDAPAGPFYQGALDMSGILFCAVCLFCVWFVANAMFLTIRDLLR